MIVDRGGAEIDDAVALNRVVAALDLRLSTEITAEGKANRLFEEVGGLAASIVVLEHGASWTPVNENPEPLGAMDVLAVLCAVGRLAHHHQVRVRIPDLDVADGSGNPYVLLTLLTQAGGALAEAVRHVTGAKAQHEGNRALAFDRLVWAVDNAVTRTVAIANHYRLRDDLRTSLQNTYQEYQAAGFLRGAVTDES
jgi:hypothetical protein